MYGELQRDMGPYRAVCIALYMFTHVLQVNVFLACTDKTHTNFTLSHVRTGQFVYGVAMAGGWLCQLPG